MSSELLSTQAIALLTKLFDDRTTMYIDRSLVKGYTHNPTLLRYTIIDYESYLYYRRCRDSKRHGGPGHLEE